MYRASDQQGHRSRQDNTDCCSGVLLGVVALKNNISVQAATTHYRIEHAHVWLPEKSGLTQLRSEEILMKPSDKIPWISLFDKTYKISFSAKKNG